MSLKEIDSKGNFSLTTTDKIIHENKNKFKDWMCSAGLKGLHIDNDGNIWKAVCFSAAVDKFNYAGWGNFIKDKAQEQGFFKSDFFQKEKFSDWSTNHPKYYTKYSKEYKKKIESYQKFIFANDKTSYKGIVGNIYEGFFESRESILNYTKCPFDSCGCGSDIWYPKIKSIEEEKYCLNLSKQDPVNLKNNKTINLSALEPNYKIDYQVLWDLSRHCNYSCDYCWPSTHSPYASDLKSSTVINLLDIIINWLLNPNKEEKNKIKTRFFFGGGEPTIFPEFLEICQWLYDNDQIISLSTNGTNSLDYYNKLAHFADNFLFSVHFKSMRDFKIKNEKGILDNINKVIDVNKTLYDRDKWVEIKIMSPPGYVKKSIEFYKKCLNETDILKESKKCFDKKNIFQRSNGSVTIVPIREIGQSNKKAVYEKEELLLLEEFYANII